MRKIVMAGMLTLAVLLICTTSSTTAAVSPTITLLNDLPTHLAVGESYTIDILVDSVEPFILALALPDQYYPGRGVFFHSSDRATRATTAILHLTITGKKSTADLPAVDNWPETEDWPTGVAPVAVVVGVRYGHGQVVAQRFNFAVTVP